MEFSTVVTPITDCLKKGEFTWSKATMKAFVEIKKRMVEAPVMHVPDFSKVLEVAFNASGIRIGGVLSLKNHCGLLQREVE